MMFKAEFREEIGKAIPRILEYLKDTDGNVRSAATEALSLLGAYCMCPSVSLLLLSLNDVQSGISRGDWQGHTLHSRISEGFR
jgi:HEAT repeat protein